MVKEVMGIVALGIPLATVSVASQVSYTDPVTSEVTNTVPLGVDGRFNFRIQTNPVPTFGLATLSVQVKDNFYLMSAGCYPMGNDESILVTSELVVPGNPEVTVTAVAFSDMGCVGVASKMSNPIVVEFTPESPMLLEP